MLETMTIGTQSNTCNRCGHIDDSIMFHANSKGYHYHIYLDCNEVMDILRSMDPEKIKNGICALINPSEPENDTVAQIWSSLDPDWGFGISGSEQEILQEGFFETLSKEYEFNVRHAYEHIGWFKD